MTTASVPQEFADLAARIASEVAAVESVLEASIESQVKLVHDVGRHTLRAGGKRLRPALAMLCAQATGLPVPADRVRRLAASLELVHMATLLHDDVIDRSSTRRGLPTAAAVFGNTASILSGDVFLSKAMAILAQDGDLGIIRAVSASVVDLAEGEVLELDSRGRTDLSVDEHLRILDLKTASFLRACCEVGARAVGADDGTRQQLGDYGFALGIAFQICDDLLDYQGDHAKTGKVRGTDFREGCPTLPLLVGLPQLAQDDRQFVVNCFGNEPSDADVESVLTILDAAGAFAEARRMAVAWADKAVAALENLPGGEPVQVLGRIAAFTIGREG